MKRKINLIRVCGKTPKSQSRCYTGSTMVVVEVGSQINPTIFSRNAGILSF